MLWLIALLVAANLGVAIAIYRRPPSPGNEAELLELAAQINQAAAKIAGSGERIEESTEAVSGIENPGGNI